MNTDYPECKECRQFLREKSEGVYYCFIVNCQMFEEEIYIDPIIYSRHE